MAATCTFVYNLIGYTCMHVATVVSRNNKLFMLDFYYM